MLLTGNLGQDGSKMNEVSYDYYVIWSEKTSGLKRCTPVLKTSHLICRQPVRIRLRNMMYGRGQDMMKVSHCNQPASLVTQNDLMG